MRQDQLDRKEKPTMHDQLRYRSPPCNCAIYEEEFSEDDCEDTSRWCPGVSLIPKKGGSKGSDSRNIKGRNTRVNMLARPKFGVSKRKPMKNGLHRLR